METIPRQQLLDTLYHLRPAYRGGGVVNFDKTSAHAFNGKVAVLAECQCLSKPVSVRGDLLENLLRASETVRDVQMDVSGDEVKLQLGKAKASLSQVDATPNTMESLEGDPLELEVDGEFFAGLELSMVPKTDVQGTPTQGGIVCNFTDFTTLYATDDSTMMRVLCSGDKSRKKDHLFTMGGDFCNAVIDTSKRVGDKAMLLLYPNAVMVHFGDVQVVGMLLPESNIDLFNQVFDKHLEGSDEQFFTVNSADTIEPLKRMQTMLESVPPPHRVVAITVTGKAMKLEATSPNGMLTEEIPVSAASFTLGRTVNILLERFDIGLKRATQLAILDNAIAFRADNFDYLVSARA